MNKFAKTLLTLSLSALLASCGCSQQPAESSSSQPSQQTSASTASSPSIASSDTSQSSAVTSSTTTSSTVPVVNKYKATFVVNGGDAVLDIEAKEGEAFVKPTDPSKEGYTFGGWYSDEALTSAYDWNSKANANITLYAKWVEKEPDPVVLPYKLAYGNEADPTSVKSADLTEMTPDAGYTKQYKVQVALKANDKVAVVGGVGELYAYKEIEAVEGDETKSRGLFNVGENQTDAIAKADGVYTFYVKFKTDTDGKTVCSIWVDYVKDYNYDYTKLIMGQVKIGETGPATEPAMYTAEKTDVVNQFKFVIPVAEKDDVIGFALKAEEGNNPSPLEGVSAENTPSNNLVAMAGSGMLAIRTGGNNIEVYFKVVGEDKFEVYASGYVAPKDSEDTAKAYYVVGDMTEWDTLYSEFGLSPMGEDQKVDGHVQYESGVIAFSAGQKIKVASKDKKNWFPDGQGGDYTIPESGSYKIYFVPEGNSEWANGFFYVAKQGGDPVNPDDPVTQNSYEIVYGEGDDIHHDVLAKQAKPDAGYAVQFTTRLQLIQGDSFYIAKKDDAKVVYGYNQIEVDSNDATKSRGLFVPDGETAAKAKASGIYVFYVKIKVVDGVEQCDIWVDYKENANFDFLKLGASLVPASGTAAELKFKFSQTEDMQVLEQYEAEVVGAKKGDEIALTYDGAAMPMEKITVEGGNNNLEVKEGKILVRADVEKENLYFKVMGKDNFHLYMGGYAVPKDDEASAAAYYVVGDMTEWEPLYTGFGLKAMGEDQNVNGHTQYESEVLKLSKGQKIKVASKDKKNWYPNGQGDDYVIPETGEYKIYFVPEGNDAWANHYFHVAKQGQQEQETKAIAVSVNGTVINTANLAPQGSTDKAKYEITLAAGDKLAIKEGDADLHFYKTVDGQNKDQGAEFVATIAGKHTVYVNKDSQIWVTEPVPEAKNVTATVNGETVTATNVKEATDTENKGVYKFTLAANDKLAMKEGDTALHFYAKDGTETVDLGTELQAKVAGEWTVYLNAKNELWFTEPKPEDPIPEQSTFTVAKNDAAVAVTFLTPSGTNKAEFKMTLAVGDKIAIKEGATALKVNGGEETVFTATKAGEHTFYVNKDSEVWVTEPTVVGTFAVTVNDTAVSPKDLKKGGTDKVVYALALQKDDVVVIKEDGTALQVGNDSTAKSYTAPAAGTYIFYVNKDGQIWPNAAESEFKITRDVGDGKSVFVAGSFYENWKLDMTHKLEWHEGNVWSKSFDDIPEGIYEFKYVIANTADASGANWDTLNPNNRTLVILAAE